MSKVVFLLFFVFHVCLSCSRVYVLYAGLFSVEIAAPTLYKCRCLLLPFVSDAAIGAFFATAPLPTALSGLFLLLLFARTTWYSLVSMLFCLRIDVDRLLADRSCCYN